MMGGTIFGHKTAPVDAKSDRKVLRRHIMHDLVIGPL